MNAILLVGGLGTRLRPLTLKQPKALLPVLNKPFLAYQLDLLREAGAKHVMMAAGKIIRQFEHDIKALEKPGLKIHFAYEPFPMGTGGAVRFSYEALKKKKMLTNGPVLVFNGDIFIDFDAKAFLRFHKKKQSLISILLTKVQDPSRFGVVSMSKTHRVSRFVEKPKDRRFGNLVNAGAYVLEPEWIETIPQGEIVSIERQSFPEALRDRTPVHGFVMSGYWNDIGTPVTYLNAHHDLLTASNRWTQQRFLRKRGFLPEKGVRGRPTTNGISVIGRSTFIGKNVVLNGTVCCGRNVIIEDDCIITDSVLMDRVVVKKGAVVEGSIIGRAYRVEKFSKIGKGSVLA